MIILLFILMGGLSAFVHLWTLGFPSSLQTISEIVVLHQFVVPHGIIAVLGFYINVIVRDKTAQSLGWPGGPFQIKYGFSQLHLGVMGVLCIFFRGNFWLATLVCLYFYGLSGLWTHGMFVRRADGSWNKEEVASIVADLVYHIGLTLIALNIPQMWAM